jgi:hypothetical protein
MRMSDIKYLNGHLVGALVSISIILRTPVRTAGPNKWYSLRRRLHSSRASNRTAARLYFAICNRGRSLYTNCYTNLTTLEGWMVCHFDTTASKKAKHDIGDGYDAWKLSNRIYPHPDSWSERDRWPNLGTIYPGTRW